MLKGKHLSLFAVEKEDLQQLRDWRNNSNFRKHFREFRELNMRQQEVWFEKQVVADDSTLMFSIRSNEDNQLLGCCGLVYMFAAIFNVTSSIYYGAPLGLSSLVSEIVFTSMAYIAALNFKKAHK